MVAVADTPVQEQMVVALTLQADRVEQNMAQPCCCLLLAAQAVVAVADTLPTMDLVAVVVAVQF
jgi:hypothetical protein